MPQYQIGEEFFRGVIREPDGPGEKLVVGKANEALARRIAIKEAEKLNWDWIVERCRAIETGHDTAFTVIEQWSSVSGHESFEGEKS